MSRSSQEKADSDAAYERALKEAPFGTVAVTAERAGQLASSVALCFLLGLGWLHGWFVGIALLAFVPSVIAAVCWVTARLRGEPWIMIEPRLDYQTKPPRGDEP